MLNSSFSICIMQHKDMHSYPAMFKIDRGLHLDCCVHEYVIWYISFPSFLFFLLLLPISEKFNWIFVFNLLIHQSFVSLVSVFSLFITQNWYYKFHANTILMIQYTLSLWNWYRVIICPFGHKLYHTIFWLCPTFFCG